MRLAPLRLVLALVASLTALPASAITVDTISIEGLDDPAMRDNVREALSLNDEVGKDLSARRLSVLLRNAEAEARDALEPFGYYAPTITIYRSDRARPIGEGVPSSGAPSAEDASADDDADTAGQARDRPRADGVVQVRIVVQAGRPVVVRGFDVGVDGEASGDASVRAAVAAFEPRQGEVLDHARYEASKGAVSRALAAHGYFDADFASRRVEVTRAAEAADIALRWTSGARHRLGEVRFTQSPSTVIRPSLLEKLVPWTPGEPYDEDEVERLRRSLVGLDYFGLVELVPQDADDGDALQVPIQVNLTPAPRSIYSAGVSYGTQSGPGVSLGVERRYLNSRGHKALAQLDYARERKLLTLQYRLPAFAWLDGWYSASLQAADEQTGFLDTRRLEFVASRSGQYNQHLNLVASLHVLRERWAYNVADDGGGALAPIDYLYASFVFPSLRAEYIDVDDRLAPRRGAGGTLTLRGGKGGADGNTGFVQLHASVQWFKGLDPASRLIVRGEAGRTFTNDLLNLPPSLRFFAGGDRSVRGYGWHEIGPRVDTEDGLFSTGAANVITASAEYERYVRGPWGGAVFIDTGSAFDGRSPDLHTGIGVGLRWRSPVGPVRLDIAHGLKSPDSPITLHLNIGADL